jgi:hypothetical protein
MATSMYAGITRASASKAAHALRIDVDAPPPAPSTPSTPAADVPPTPHAPTKRPSLPPGKHTLSPEHALSPGTFALTRRRLLFPVVPDARAPPAPAPEPYKTLADEALNNLFRT